MTTTRAPKRIMMAETDGDVDEEQGFDDHG
jgi:hypothetical protein